MARARSASGSIRTRSRSVSQVRFDVFVGRTAYEVVQVASVLYPWAAPVVRTITIRTLRENALVFRADSGWVATGPGLYRYPPIDPCSAAAAGGLDADRDASRCGCVARSTCAESAKRAALSSGRCSEKIELLEVRFDADMQIEGVVSGQIPRNGPRAEHRSGRLRATLAEGPSAGAAATSPPSWLTKGRWAGP